MSKNEHLVTENQIRQMLIRGESATAEFMSEPPPATMLASVIAEFANGTGGTILMGVRKSGEVVGIHLPTIGRIVEAAISQLQPPPEINTREITLDGKTLGIIDVTSSNETVVIDNKARVSVRDLFLTDSAHRQFRIASDASDLSTELASLREQLLVFQKEAMTSTQVEQRVNEIIEAADRAVGRSEDLKARLFLPPSDLTDIRLVPAHLLERLEEYHADGNLAFLLIGALIGALVGIPVNWATNEEVVFNEFTVALVCIVLILIICTIVWTSRLIRRAKLVKEKMLYYPVSSLDKD